MQGICLDRHFISFDIACKTDIIVNLPIIKDISKNLQIKNLLKLEAMASEQASLALYENATFYKPKDIYLEQLNIFDNRQIYVNGSLASYIKADKVAIKANALHEINLKKQRLLIELEELKNGKI